MIQVNIVNRKLVKPCIPTPQNLQTYQFSILDELQNDRKFGVILFYATNEIEIKLEESLAKVLVQFYPLAGRFKMKDGCVDCSDQGVEFVEAEAPDVELPTLVAETNIANLDGFYPCVDHQQEEANRPILSVQITFLKCGGVALAIYISHKIFDASSLMTFLTAWSIASNPRLETPLINRILYSTSLFPAKRQNINLNIQLGFPNENSLMVVKRFTFNKEAIASLRSKLRQGGFMSRVRVVSACIAKALISVHRGGTSSLKPYYIIQVVNIRERTIPPLPKHLCGNLLIPSCTGAVEAEDMGFQELVDLVSEAIDKSVSKCREIFTLNEDGLYKLMVEPLMNAITDNIVLFTDWSKFGFNQLDIGWGKPVGATPLQMMTQFPQALLIEDREGGGMNAWVASDQHIMDLFERHEEIRSLTRN